jgi:hypothetical protein
LLPKLDGRLLREYRAQSFNYDEDYDYPGGSLEYYDEYCIFWYQGSQAEDECIRQFFDKHLPESAKLLDLFDWKSVIPHLPVLSEKLLHVHQNIGNWTREGFGLS